MSVYMLADLFFIFSMALFLIRLAKYNTLGTYWVGIDLLSGLLMFFAFYFFVFPPITITQVSGDTAITILTPSETVPLDSGGFIILVTMVTLYLVLSVVLGIRDFVLRREAFPENLSPRQ